MEGRKVSFAGKAVKIVLCCALVLLVLLSSPNTALALNANLVESEQNGWYEVDDVTLYEEPDFSGVLKKIVDEENGCMYIFFQFDDDRVQRTELDNIIISFKVKNSLGEYRFSVNRNGFVNTGDNEKNNIKLCWNFDHLSHRGSFNYLFVGFELCSKFDREQNNEITCLYSCGNEKVYTLFKDVSLNMYNPQVSTGKSDKTSKTTTKSAKTVKASTTNSGKTVKQATTKYTPTGLIGTKRAEEESSGNDDLDGILEKYKSTSASSSEDDGERDADYSTSTKVLIAVAGVGGLTGLMLIVYASAKKDNKPPDENKNE